MPPFTLSSLDRKLYGHLLCHSLMAVIGRNILYSSVLAVLADKQPDSFIYPLQQQVVYRAILGYPESLARRIIHECVIVV